VFPSITHQGRRNAHLIARALKIFWFLATICLIKAVIALSRTIANKIFINTFTGLTAKLIGAAAGTIHLI
jgi:hypothetical protein